MAGRFRILTPDAPYSDGGTVEKEAAGPDYDFDVHGEDSASAISDESFARADALLVWHKLPIDSTVIPKLSNCRIVMRAGVGYDHIDLEACGAAGLPVCNTPDYGTAEVADHAIALTLALKRGLLFYHDRLRRDPVGSFRPDGAPGMTRHRGQVFGIVGLGRIGTAAALRAKAFGFRVMAYDPFIPAGQQIAVGVERCGSLKDLLGQADVVSVHAPLTPETQGMIGQDALAAIKPGAFLVNTARGAIVDANAVLAALKENRLAGAALDVLASEPPDVDDPLIKAYSADEEWLSGRLLLTPHAAWFSDESCHDARRLSTERMAAFLESGRLDCCVNAEFLKPRA